MEAAYGAPREPGGKPPLAQGRWEREWRRAQRLHPSGQYAFPKRGTGRRLVRLTQSLTAGIRSRDNRSEALLLMLDPHIKKAKKVRETIESRLNLWEQGEKGRETLLQEATKISRRAHTSSRRGESESQSKKEDEKAAGLPKMRKFRNFIQAGEMRRGIRILIGREKGGVLDGEDTFTKRRQTYQVAETLKAKHPPKKTPQAAALEAMPREGLPTLTPLLITEEDITAVARRLQDSAGPSGLDSTQLRIAVLSLGRESRELREELANLATEMGRRVFEWDQVKALMACRLVALDKCPGVCLVGIGEAIRRFLRKAVMKETREEQLLQEACGADQQCSGLMGGLEGGIHAVRELWETLTQEAGDDPEKAFGTLLIDAKNAFNAANRTARLWNARILWLRASTFLFNCYRGDAELFLRGTHGTTTISSREGWTQGDPMSMAGYAITILPLVQALRGSGSGQTESETQSEASGSSQAAGEKQTRMRESRQADRETQSESSENS
uniref:Reverse transcriptase domain-containing protein n=1 Tax=Chromera velia CCMP2878 TaxID=1169474 RepID=A0A0G4I0N2_9ALVE|eukprot:Cvel_34422.t1-p1 / transcript=Cvel_34422.t1 / gene=Cvel_34422 / organism=Chromera_velia_CCMP2878 / gene_product=hypothetical protein / transcript_product=hypothetical protein / location=Cvel_scaffold5910:2317-3813(+) / protein_length=499 / sequence_SO=supercontig / SO=protein_coding / is_pseudo=false